MIEVADFLRSSQRIQKFLKNQYQTPRLFSYSQHLADFRAIEEQIYTKIHNQKVATDASRQLRKIRRQINECQQEIETKVTKFLRNKNNQLHIQENMMVKKGNITRYQSKLAIKIRFQAQSLSNPIKDKRSLLNL